MALKLFGGIRRRKFEIIYTHDLVSFQGLVPPAVMWTNTKSWV